MILYQIVSTYHLLCAIVHKVKMHKDQKAILIIPTWIVDKFPQYQELEKYFTKIVVMDMSKKFVKGYPKNHIVQAEKLLKDNKLNIKDFTEIHSMGTHYQFGSYLVNKNIPFYFWEDAAGVLSRSKIVESIEKGLKINDNKYEICRKAGLYDGSAPCVIKRYCNYSAQEAGYDLSNTIDFSVVKELISLDDDVRKDIMMFFTKVQTLDIEKDSVIYLTQHFSSLNVMSFDEHLLINQLVMDYFFEKEKVVIKPHPDDVAYHDVLFPECRVVREKFPSEFLPLMFNNKPKCIATISSTAIFNLRDSVDKTFELSTRFEKEFYSIHKYAVAMDIKNRLFTKYNIENVGAMQDVVDKFTNVIKDGKNVFYIVDDLYATDKTKQDIVKMTKDASSSDVFVFINSKNDYVFYDVANKQLWNNIVPITITKTKTKQDDFYADEESETIYIYSKNKALLDQLKQYTFVKNLKYTGLNISVKVKDKDDLAIDVLDGLRYATEHMLEQIELVYNNVKDDKDYSGIIDIDESNIQSIVFSNCNIQNEKHNTMRILEGIIKSTEQRILYYKKEK